MPAPHSHAKIKPLSATSAPRIIYLHGFASSPQSRKALYFGQKLRDLGFNFSAPDMADGDFQGLTISKQLKLLDRLNPASKPVALMGSSLGGFVAASYAAAHPEVSKLVLLAPAFDFRELWAHRLGQSGVDSWRQNGSMSVFHYGEGRNIPIGYQLYEDAAAFAGFPKFEQPALVFHGNHDAVVPVGQSIEFASLNSNARLIRVESGHELTDVLDAIWPETRDFLLDKQLESQW